MIAFMVIMYGAMSVVVSAVGLVLLRLNKMDAVLEAHERELAEIETKMLLNQDDQKE